MRTELYQPATAPLGVLVETIAALDPVTRLAIRGHLALDALGEALVRVRETAIVLHTADELTATPRTVRSCRGDSTMRGTTSSAPT